ncbi:MAG: DUF1611 domain-containing protein [Desulfuromusa sp.]|jgi:uncharacterized NAD-dependent epimerase/dehydratase family protein|nr:DUF1611 domain-containing protein [Desulfuromusa sp.]
MNLQHPYLMFLGDVQDQLAAKTCDGIVHWRPEWSLGQFRLPNCKADVKLDDMTLTEGLEKGAKTLLIGIVNQGGFLPEHWTASIVEALQRGYDVASGLHAKLGDIPEIAMAAEKYGRRLFDVRHPSATFEPGTGVKRAGKRCLAVGTDCSVGKMYTPLAMEKEMIARDMKVSFRATGQTGIFIAGTGVSVDAVVSDFISGAVEQICPANDPDHWDLIEGQGSLFHPSYAGVTLGLTHGAQPDALVLCHEPTRTHMRGLPNQKLPDLQTCLELNLAVARLTNVDAKFIGVAINTANLESNKAETYLAEVEQLLGLPTVDPVRTGVVRLVDNLLNI